MSNTKALFIKWLADKTGRTEVTTEPSAVLEKSASSTAQDYEYDSSEEPYVPIGLNGLMASTERLLAVNKGLADTDFRDSAYFKKHFEADRQIWERIRTDTGSPRKKLLRMVSSRRNLSALSPFYFDDYAEKHITGNPLVTPLEEINPMHLVENSRRITGMGPGGIPSDDSITPEMNSVSATQFGFIDTIAGPECFDNSSFVYTKRGWIQWTDVKDDDIFACRINGRLEFHKADRIIRANYNGDMILAESSTCRMCVTPNHRVLYKKTTLGPEYISTAEELLERLDTRLPTQCLPMEGDPNFTSFTLPSVDYHKMSRSKPLPTFDIEDWCEFVGWWLSEGSSGVKGRKGVSGKVCKYGYVSISQCPVANPEKHEKIRSLLIRMGLHSDTQVISNSFVTKHEQMVSYFSQYEEGCYNKWIPTELFHAPVEARKKLLDALLMGDGRTPRNRKCYVTVSRRLAEDVLRLATELGIPSFIREEPDKRQHVRTTNWVVSMHQRIDRVFRRNSYLNKNGGLTGNNWSKVPYNDTVYCATVPGGLLLVKGRANHVGYWSGNSGRAGVDVRMTWGSKMGSNGRIYQLFRNKRTGKLEWKSPFELDGKNVKLPD